MPPVKSSFSQMVVASPDNVTKSLSGGFLCGKMVGVLVVSFRI